MRAAHSAECGAEMAPSKMGRDARSAEIPARQDSEETGLSEGSGTIFSYSSVLRNWKGQGGWAQKTAVAPAAVAALVQTLRAERECGEPSSLQRAGTARLTHMHQTSHPLITMHASLTLISALCCAHA